LKFVFHFLYKVARRKVTSQTPLTPKPQGAAIRQKRYRFAGMFEPGRRDTMNNGDELSEGRRTGSSRRDAFRQPS
jgi:hypothetical protein